MIKCLVICGLLAITAGTARAAQPEWRVFADLLNGPPSTDGSPPSDPAADSAKSCDQVTFSRNLKYGENDLNVLDVATGDIKDATPRPVLLFVAGESFASVGTTGAAGNGQDKAQDNTLQDKAMCFAARNDMVGVSMTYRLAP